MATSPTTTLMQTLAAHRAKRPEHGEPNFLAWAQGETLAQVLVWTVRQAPVETSNAMLQGALEYLYLSAVHTWGAAAVAETPAPKAGKCRTVRKTVATAGRKVVTR